MRTVSTVRSSSAVRYPSRNLFIINTAAFLRSFIHTLGSRGVVPRHLLVSLSVFPRQHRRGCLRCFGSALQPSASRQWQRPCGTQGHACGAFRSLARIGAPSSPFPPPFRFLLVMAFVECINEPARGTARLHYVLTGIIPDCAGPSRTWGLAWYNVVSDAAGFVGSTVCSPAALSHRGLPGPLSSP